MHLIKIAKFFSTVRKLQNFFTTRILREINLEDPTSSKTAISTILEPLTFILANFWLQKMPKNQQNLNSNTQNCQKGNYVGLLETRKLISRKIWEAEKAWNFHTLFS